MRPTIAVIHRSHLRHNFQRVRERSQHGNVLAVIKANAYGHGSVECAKIFLAEGATMLGVAIADEAIPLRADPALQTAPIFVLTPPFADEAEEYCRLNLAFSAASTETVRAFNATAKTHSITLAAHLYVDTGFRRDGIEPHEAVEFMQACADCSHIRFDGLCTHFATADERDTSFVHEQLRNFLIAVNALREAGYTPKWIHAANSGGITQTPESHWNLVRSGIALYGYNASEEVSKPLKIKPALTLKTRVASLRSIPAGSPVSYGRKYIAEQQTTIATLPVGYADGLPRALSVLSLNEAQCLIHGKRFPIVGRICMDECMVNVGSEAVRVGDEVVILGEQRSTNVLTDGLAERITADELACRAQTISYEILAGISTRVQRVYAE